MNDEAERPQRDILKTRNSIARSLREVEYLALDLHTQALNTPNDRDFPGGTALHMLAPAAVLQDWEAQYEDTEARERWSEDGRDLWDKRADRDPATYQGNENEQPLNVLATWVRMIREDRNQPTSLTPTLSRETDYLRGQLDWVCRVDTYGDPEWPLCFEMATELRTLVRRMENVLRDGDRIDTDAAPCFQLDTEGNQCRGTLARVNLKPRECVHATFANRSGRNLIQVLASSASYAKDHKTCDQGGRDDLYRCLKCAKNYTTTEYWLAVSDNHERQAAG